MTYVQKNCIHFSLSFIFHFACHWNFSAHWNSSVWTLHFWLICCLCGVRGVKSFSMNKGSIFPRIKGRQSSEFFNEEPKNALQFNPDMTASLTLNKFWSIEFSNETDSRLSRSYHIQNIRSHKSYNIWFSNDNFDFPKGNEHDFDFSLSFRSSNLRSTLPNGFSFGKWIFATLSSEIICIK